MKFRTLGQTNLKVSVIGMGTWQFGGEWGKTFEQAEVNAMFAQAADLGINLIDTAECYGDHLSESLIGHATAASRDRWIIATKFGHVFHGHLQRTEPRTPADVTQQLEASLSALQTDHIDLYQYHSWGDSQFISDDVRAVLEKARAAGKVLHLGNSIGSNDNLYQVERAPAFHVAAVQVVYNRLDRKSEQRLFPACQRLGLGVLARVPLASGYLSGKYQPGTRFANPGDVRHSHPPATIDDKLRLVQQIQQSEVPPGVPMAEWALAWCLQHPAVTSVIPGCKSVEQVQSNARAASLPLVRDDHPQAAHDPKPTQP